MKLSNFWQLYATPPPQKEILKTIPFLHMDKYYSLYNPVYVQL